MNQLISEGGEARLSLQPPFTAGWHACPGYSVSVLIAAYDTCAQEGSPERAVLERALHWEVGLECHLLPEMRRSASIGNGPWPSLLGRKQREQGGPISFLSTPSWLVPFDVKVPGEAGLCH